MANAHIKSIDTVVQPHLLHDVMSLLFMCRITEEHPFKAVMCSGDTHLEHTRKHYKVFCRKQMNVPLMASAVKAGENTGLNTVDGYIVPSRCETAQEDEDEQPLAVPDGGNAAPVDESDSEPPPLHTNDEENEPPTATREKKARKQRTRLRKKLGQQCDVCGHPRAYRVDLFSQRSRLRRL